MDFREVKTKGLRRIGDGCVSRGRRQDQPTDERRGAQKVRQSLHRQIAISPVLSPTLSTPTSSLCIIVSSRFAIGVPSSHST